MKIIEYQEIKLIKQSEKSRVLLARDLDGEKLYVQKSLKGRHPIYSILQSCPHPYLPKLYEVILSDEVTIIIEEYIEGYSLGCAQLTEKQIVNAIKELCAVLEFLHKKDIIHRDIKPSNIIFATDGHIRLIDFDAARMPKDDLERDTRLLGTRGYAPPEQYGFAQTDARTDIYSLGVTLNQLLGEQARKPRYRRVINKCTNLNPDKRYQTAQQVKRAFSLRGRAALYSIAGIVLIAALCYAISRVLPVHPEIPPVRQSVISTVSEPVDETSMLTVLPAPENPHWDNDTGIVVFGNVPESGDDKSISYRWRLYRTDTAAPPNLNVVSWERERPEKSSWSKDQTASTFHVNVSPILWRNGFYHVAIAAVGDGVHYADSAYVLSDAFEYTGEDAPPLPAPTGLTWKLVEDDGLRRCASWSNLDAYMETDEFYVDVYNQFGSVLKQIHWSKEEISLIGHDGIVINFKEFAKPGEAYRFTVRVITSRPNAYKSSTIPSPVPEEYFSPWYRPLDYEN